MRIDFQKPRRIKFLLLLLLPVGGYSQNLTGIWRGYFISDYGEQYKYELQIEQSTANHINGVSYSYLDTRFYGKAILTGSFMKTSKSAMIKEIKTVEVKMASGSEACIMKCMFAYAKSGKEEFLEGTYTSIYEKANATNSIEKASGCGGGKVILRKVATTEFYVEPFLRKKLNPRIISKTPENKITKAPQRNNQNVTKKQVTTKPPVLPSHIVKAKRVKDTLQVSKTTNPHLPESTIEKFHLNIPVVTRSRQNELVETINVGSRDITIRLYDNGEIDDDTISVYLDGKPLTMNRRLSTVPITLTIHLDDDNNEHILIMYAENMGRIPPNTSLMIVQDGDKRYQVNITSTEQTNAMVRFRYQKK